MNSINLWSTITALQKNYAKLLYKVIFYDKKVAVIWKGYKLWLKKK